MTVEQGNHQGSGQSHSHQTTGRRERYRERLGHTHR
jgi:hypothetical protein